LATLTATKTFASDAPVRRATVALVAGPLRARRLETALGAGFQIVTRGRGARALGEAGDVTVLAGEAELLRREGAVEQLRERAPDCPIVVVSERDDRSFVRKCLRAGVRGFVCERDIDPALQPTVRAVLAGQLSVPQTIRDRIAWRTFSLRERQVLQCVADGLTNAQIADRLYLSESTIKSHLSSSFRKLGVSSRAEAAAAVLDPTHGLGAELPRAAMLLPEGALARL
jgi:DNA-binding NarL/FixJ family response regulator